jgi:hypothetical protein
MLARMRAVFIFVVLLVLIALALPTAFVVRVWLDGGATVTQAQQNGLLRGAGRAVEPAGIHDRHERV